LWLWRQKHLKEQTISDHPVGDRGWCQGLLGLLRRAEPAPVCRGLSTPSAAWDGQAGPGSSEVAFSSLVSELINPSGLELLMWGQL